MATAQPEDELDLLTVAEVARLLKISPVTVHRWIKAGRLPAYRFGPRCVRLRRADLRSLSGHMDEVSAAARPAMNEVDTGKAGPGEQEKVLRTLGIQSPTPEVVRRRREVLERMRLHLEEMRTARGGKPIPPSWPLIREEREKISRQI